MIPLDSALSLFSVPFIFRPLVCVMVVAIALRLLNKF